MSFDWQTEDTDWDDAPPLPDPEPPRKRPFRYLWLVALLALVAVAAVWLLRQLDSRIDVAETTIASDLQASHDIVRRAILTDDGDLFRTVLSGREPWSSAINDTFRAGVVLQRDGMGLAWLPAQSVTPTITLSPTLTAGTAVFTETYAIDIGGGITDTIQLQQTHVYRLGPNRWLLSPPNPPETTVNDVIESAHLFLSFPLPETAVAQRLALDLDAILAHICNLPDLTCPADYQQVVELDTSPDALIWLDMATLLQRGESRITLPAPSLVGLPVDEAGYQALARGYGRLLAAATIADLTGYDCCELGALFAALLTAYNQQLGLQGSPLSPADWAQLATDLPTLDMVGTTLQDSTVWPDPDTNLDVLHSLLAFLVQDVGLSVAKLQRVILAGENPLPPPLHDAAKLQRQWWHFLQENAPSLPPSLVSPSLTLLCLHDTGILVEVNYDLATAVFTPNASYPYRDGRLLPLPGGSEAVVLRDPGGRTFIRQNGSETTIAEVNLSPELAPQPVKVGGNGRYLLLYTPGVSSLPYTLLDLDTCTNGACSPASLFGLPIWSPDGSQTLVLGTNLPPVAAATASGTLSVNNAAAKEPASLGGGQSPFWLDDQTVGYISSNDDTQLVLLDLTTFALTTITLDDLNAQLDADFTEATTRFVWAAADPSRLNSVLLLVQQGASRPTTLLLRVGVMDTAVTPLLTSETERILDTQFSFSPDGRWLVITRQLEAAGSQQFIVALESGQITPRYWASPTSGELVWSADSRWFALLQDGIVQLVQPETAVVQAIIAPDARCTSVAFGSD